MATHYSQPTWAGQLFLWVLYVLFVMVMVHATIAIGRTLAVKLPLRLNKHGAPVELITDDYGPRLRHSDDVSRKALKLVVYVLSNVFFAGCWAVVLAGTFYIQDPVFGWTLLPDGLVGGIHLGLLLGVLPLALSYGIRTAARYEMAPPFQRLDDYLLTQLREGSEGRFNKTPVRHERDHPVYELTLPGGGVVLACLEGEKIRWFEFTVPQSGEIRLQADDKLTRDVTFRVNVYLAVNGI